MANDYLAELCELIVSRSEATDGALSDICTQVTDKASCTEAQIDSYVSTESLLADKNGRQLAASVPQTGKVVVYKAGDTLVSNIRPYFKKIWFAENDGTCSGDVVVFRANNPSLAPYLYAILRSDKFFDYVMSGAKGTKMPRGDKKQMMSYGINPYCPERDLEIIAFAVYGIGASNQENQYLSSLRDSLLPKLMSGEIDTSKVELPTLPNNHLAQCKTKPSKMFPLLAKKGHVMEAAINLILAQMQPILANDQLKQLSEVLHLTLSPRTERDADLLELFLTAKEVEGCSSRTISYYENTIRHMVNSINKPYTHIESTDLRAYLAEYEAEHQVGKVTIDNLRRILSSFFSWLEDEDYIVKSPVRRIHRVKTAVIAKEVLNDEDLEMIREGCTNIRDLAIVDMLATTGMRIGELVKLDIADLNLNERECIVTGKGNKQRPVYFDARAKLHLLSYLDTRHDDNPALFVSLNASAERLSIGGIESRLRTIGHSTGVGRVHPHKFRRTLATHAIDKGMPIEQVQKLLGHARIDTTMHYAMVNQSNVKASHRRYLE